MSSYLLPFFLSIYLSYLVDGLASDAGVGVDVLVADGLGVGVGDPGHLALAGSHVGGWHIHARPCRRILNSITRVIRSEEAG